MDIDSRKEKPMTDIRLLDPLTAPVALRIPIVAVQRERAWPPAWLRKMTSVLSVTLAAGAWVAAEAQTKDDFAYWDANGNGDLTCTEARGRDEGLKLPAYRDNRNGTGVITPPPSRPVPALSIRSGSRIDQQEAGSRPDQSEVARGRTRWPGRKAGCASVLTEFVLFLCSLSEKGECCSRIPGDDRIHPRE